MTEQDETQRERERRCARRLLKLIEHEDADAWDGPQLVDAALVEAMAEIRSLRAELDRADKLTEVFAKAFESLGRAHAPPSTIRDAAEAWERSAEHFGPDERKHWEIGERALREDNAKLQTRLAALIQAVEFETRQLVTAIDQPVALRLRAALDAAKGEKPCGPRSATPTQPGWWWRRIAVIGETGEWCYLDPKGEPHPVQDDGRWGGPCPK